MNAVLKPLALNGLKPHGDRINTVPGVFFGDALAFEHMTQMAITLAAQNLNPLAIGIDFASNRTGYFIVERGPAAVGLKLVFRAIERLLTLAANINAAIKMIVVFSRKGSFSALLENDPRLFWRQWFSLIGHSLSLLHQVLCLSAGYQKIRGD
tara:strand:- start:527 stop:985 length:459 start_codon:yes stop_codon:yes gene_type:complete